MVTAAPASGVAVSVACGAASVWGSSGHGRGAAACSGAGSEGCAMLGCRAALHRQWGSRVGCGGREGWHCRGTGWVGCGKAGGRAAGCRRVCVGRCRRAPGSHVAVRRRSGRHRVAALGCVGRGGMSAAVGCVTASGAVAECGRGNAHRAVAGVRVRPDCGSGVAVASGGRGLAWRGVVESWPAGRCGVRAVRQGWLAHPSCGAVVTSCVSVSPDHGAVTAVWVRRGHGQQGGCGRVVGVSGHVAGASCRGGGSCHVVVGSGCVAAVSWCGVGSGAGPWAGVGVVIGRARWTTPGVASAPWLGWGVAGTCV